MLNKETRKHIQFGDIGKMNAAYRQLERQEIERAGRTKVRPATFNSGEDAKLIFPDDFALCYSSSPSSRGNDLYVYKRQAFLCSSTLDDFSTESLVVYKFDTPLSGGLPATYHRVHFGVIGAYSAGLIPSVSDNAFKGMGYYFSYNFGGATITADLYCGFELRIKEITADFDCSTLTWSGLSGLTYGTTHSKIYQHTDQIDPNYSAASNILQKYTTLRADNAGDPRGELIGFGLIPNTYSDISTDFDLVGRGLKFTADSVYGIQLEIAPIAAGHTGYLTGNVAWLGLGISLVGDLGV